MSRWLLVLALLTMPVPASATVFISEDFENSTPSVDNSSSPGVPPPNWVFSCHTQNNGGETGCPPGVPGNTFPDGIQHCLMTNERSHSGSISVKFNYLDNSANYDLTNADACNLYLNQNLPTGVTEIFVRIWRYSINYGLGGGALQNKNLYFHDMAGPAQPPGFNQPNPIFFPGEYNGEPGTPGLGIGTSKDCFGDFRTFGNYYNVDCYDSPNVGRSPGTTVAAVGNNTWNCFEWHFKLNTPGQRDGIIQSWIDEQIFMDWQNVATRGTAVFGPGGNSSQATFFGAPVLGFFLIRQHARQGSILYWDDLVIADSRIGCGGIVAQPPAAPSNLIVHGLILLGVAVALFATRRLIA